MDKTSQTVPNIHPNYIARMDELQQDLESTRMDLHQAMQENSRLKNSEKGAREYAYDADRELSRLEAALEKAYEKNDILRMQVKRLKDRQAIDARKIIELHEEIKVLHKPYLHLPTAQAPPAFADEDEITML